MNLYKVPLADPNWREQTAELEHEQAWIKARGKLYVIKATGICICVYLWVCLAFNAF